MPSEAGGAVLNCLEKPTMEEEKHCHPINQWQCWGEGGGAWGVRRRNGNDGNEEEGYSNRAEPRGLYQPDRIAFRSDHATLATLRMYA